MEALGGFLFLLFLLLPLFIVVRLLWSRGHVFQGTGCLGGCLGMLIGVPGVMYLTSWLSGASEPNAGGIVFVPVALLGGVLLGWGIAAFMQRSEQQQARGQPQAREQEKAPEDKSGE